ncbi:phosphoribosylglycinamide formyltransferase [Subsaximicrobium wynnwilliamsii]|uniref:Phosphoribosylglycinamide formyltransferase n=1 Tax=Subsaximicrobium wynnwilliamsii TaxID=291179 RepID=A0A5C6ZIL3_9FLAO|nr:phosphoribosylglycinamide formyltransferase [Subsaximicrobium wynnwilliamsii]TXD83765.1 phosphoribosylglycinamide formyltransferase [Subsaximicrobium wynnwilliamsii]TXD89352.1 phosphoribosylglycinamide formyltransferase [Subsaximicrobium wynnwilliamsii]TXE03601.1 phosphoribosylglycinamide formyltransferase [Subsaximicrobium wynnwilliamsii]
MKRIIILASGSGSNAENLIHFFRDHKTISVVQVLSNNSQAKVLERTKKLGVSAFSFNRIAFAKTDDVLKLLKASQPDLIVLAGFLWKLPEHIIEAFPDKIINIHPALLPKYGGKGMYGSFVHEAIVANKETETGISIHYVNANYDEGAIIFQTKCPVNATDTAEDIAAKIHDLEMEHFPKVVQEILNSKKNKIPKPKTYNQKLS